MAFTFKLEHETPADPPVLHTAVGRGTPATLPLGSERMLRVIPIRSGPEPDGDPTWSRLAS
jgi:hypothetical protein